MHTSYFGRYSIEGTRSVAEYRSVALAQAGQMTTDNRCYAYTA
jgi:hypothetical protein